MKLSEAIRLGAMLKPQGNGFMYNARNGTTCAMRAAVDACGDVARAVRTHMEYEEASRLFPLIDLPPVPCPACNGCTRFHSATADDICDVIWMLNDEHDWTRERIADWVETLEAAQASSTDYPQTPETIARAKAQQAQDRDEVYAVTGIRIRDEEKQ